MSERTSNHVEGGLSRRGWVALWAFPALLWFLATFFLLGDLGLWNDDWMYVQRIPETGAVRSLVLDQEVHYWRPLYRVLQPTLATLLWKHQQIHHLIGAVSHGAAALLLGLLLWRLGVRRLACSLAAMAFLVLPWPAEVVFWLSSTPTSVSVVLMLTAMHLAVGWARGAGGWWPVGAVAVLCFAACCLNEQPAMLCGALPLVVVCAAGRVDRGVAMRGAAMLAAGGFAVAVYAVFHVAHAPNAMDIGAGRGITAPDRWPDAMRALGDWIGMLLSRSWVRRALECGGAALAEHPVRAAVVAGAMAVCGALWVRVMAREGHRAAAGREPAAGWLALLGLAMVGLTMAPIVATQYWMAPRILYPPALGLAVLIAAGMTWASWRSGRESKRATRGVAAAAGGVALVVLAVAMVGVQKGYQRRALLDRELLRELRTMVPDPEPGTVFVPVRVEIPAEAGAFDLHYLNVFGSWWSSRWGVRLEYGRSDLSAGTAMWRGRGLRFPAFDGARAEGVGRRPWALIIPFEIDSDNHIRLVTDVRFFNAEGKERRERIPQTAAIAERMNLPPRVYVFPKESARPVMGKAATISGE